MTEKLVQYFNLILTELLFWNITFLYYYNEQNKPCLMKDFNQIAHYMILGGCAKECSINEHVLISINNIAQTRSVSTLYAM